jgi:lipooligosaccharide transport system permease protein
VLWAVTRASIYGGAFLLVVMLWGLATPLETLIALPLVPLAGLLFAAIGIAFSLRIPSIELFSFYFTLFLTPLFLFSDVFFPLQERLTGAWLYVAEALPLLHPVRLMRAAFGAEVAPTTLLWDLSYVFVLTTGLLALAARVIRARLRG